MRKFASRHCLVAVLAIFYALPCAAIDEETLQKFQSLVADARRAQDEGAHERAIALFDEALRLNPDPRVRYHRAVSLQALGKDEEALEEFKAIREDVLVAKYREDIEKRIEALELIAAKVPLTIKTNPPVPAMVTIGGKQKGTTPLTVSLRKGEYDISINARGYRPVTDKVRLVGPEPVVKVYDLVKVITGALALDCNETGADVFVDGVWQATTPLRAPLQLEVGHRSVRVEKMGFVPQTTEVVIMENQTTSISVLLEPPKVKPEEGPAVVLRKKKVFGYTGFAAAGLLAAAGIGFLSKYGADASKVSKGTTRTLGGEFAASTAHLGSDSLKATNAIVGGVCLGTGLLVGVATWLWLWPSE